MSFICYGYYLIGVIGLLSALVVASSLNPIHRIAFLILVFLSGSFLMIILDFYFLGLTYIIVYVGAIMILFLFVIMMVQIHLMPITLSVSPRVVPLGSSSSYNFTSGPVLSSTTAINSSTPSAVEAIRSVTLSNSLVSTIRSLVLALFLILSLVYLINTSLVDHNMVVNYFFPAWSIDFKTMTDLESLANILYVAYPTALLLIGVALWVVLIGIIKVTMAESR